MGYLIPTQKLRTGELINDFFNLDHFFNLDTNRADLRPAITVKETESNVTVTSELPGINKEEINIEYNDGVLSLSGEKHETKTEESETVLYQEVSSGEFKRSIRIKDVQFDQATADYTDGVLTIKIPKIEDAKPKRLLVD